MAKIWSCVLVLLVACVIGLGSAAAQEKKDKPAKPEPTPEEMFKRLDKNNDGKVTLDEFVGKKDGEAKTKAEEMFKKLDKKGQGFLTIDDFKAPAKKPGKKK